MAAECYELVVSGTLAGQFVQSVHHVNVSNVGDQTPYVKAQELLDTLNQAANWVQKWVDICPVSYTITSIRCRRILAAGGPTAILLGSALVASVGTRAGAISSAQLATVLVWLTTLRPDRPGRTFVPGISETDIDAMVYTAGYITKLNTFITRHVLDFTLITTSDPASFALNRRNLPGTSDQIDYGRISPVIGTQRRRLHPV